MRGNSSIRMPLSAFALLVIVALLSIGLAGCGGANTSANALEEFEGTYQGFSFAFPATWIMAKSDDTSAFVLHESKGIGVQVCDVTADIQALAGDGEDEFEAMYEYMALLGESVSQGAELRDFSSAAFSNSQGYCAISAFGFDDMQRSRTVFVDATLQQMDGRIMLCLLGCSNEKSVQEAQTAAKDILSSIKVLEPYVE